MKERGENPLDCGWVDKAAPFLAKISPKSQQNSLKIRHRYLMQFNQLYHAVQCLAENPENCLSCVPSNQDSLRDFNYNQLCNYPPQQESPPAWTQETYRPLRTKYTLCCSSWGYPLHHPDQGPDLGGGTPHQQDGIPPTPSRLHGGIPCQEEWRYPHEEGWGTPSSVESRLGTSPPPGVDWHTNWKYYLSSFFGCGRQWGIIVTF